MTQHGRDQQPLPPTALFELIDRIKPRAVGRDLIRIGGQGDGGYLIPDDLAGISGCFSPGVGPTASFETMLYERYGLKSYLADYSLDKAPVDNPGFDFEKKFLGIREGDSTMRLEDWFDRKAGPEGDADYILQMDIEGAEFGVLIDTPRRVLRRFRILIIEFHGMGILFRRRWCSFCAAIFDKLLDDFSVAHIHPNNCCGTTALGDLVVPNVFEMTLYRNDRVTPDSRPVTFPHPLDSKNVLQKEDIVLPRCWWP